MNFGTVLSNVGLESEGYNNAQKNQAELEALQQQNKLRDQQVQTGGMGLEDLKRNRSTDASIRTAGATGAAGGAGVTGSLDSMALAAEQAGDVNKALAFRQAKKKLEDEGMSNVVHKALIDPRPGPRPDLAEEFNRYGQKRDMDPNSLTLDDKGNLTYSDPKTGKSGSINVGTTAERLGLVKPFEKEIPAGGMYIRGNPATGQTQTFRNDAAPKFDVKDGIIFNDQTGAFQQVGQGEWKLGNITNGTNEITVSINSKTGEVQQLGPGGARSGMEAKIVPPTVPGGPTMIAMPGGGVAEFRPAQEATPGQNHWLSPNEPGKPAQPAQVVPVAQPETPPVEGAMKAPDGKWYVRQGDKYAPVIVGGQAKPAAPAAKPAPAAAPEKTTQPAANKTEDIPEVAAPVEKGSAKSRHAETVAGIKSDREKKAKMKPVETFRAIAASSRMTADDIPLIEEALKTGMLTSEETDKANRMLSKLKPQTARYARGGKVQRHGLNG